MKDIEAIKSHIEKYDRLISIFNMHIEEFGLGSCRISMNVGDDHLNAAKLCHGAVIFALADVAFALASNSHGKMALALEASINYFRPVKPGSIIYAVARERHGGRRTGFFEVEIIDQEERLVASFKATAFKVEDTPIK